MFYNSILNLQINNSKLVVQVAQTLPQKKLGLKNRKNLGENHGMLFIFETPQKLTFWMEKTEIPLDLAFINKQKIIKEIYDLIPYDLSIIESTGSDLCYALEVNKGWFNKNNIKVNDQISIL